MYSIDVEMPDYLRVASELPTLLRLRGVGMNCGLEYTSFPRFSRLKPYSRYDHSLRCALLTLYFGGNQEEALSSLFHDISTPCFSHVVDFLLGDYEKQEATEERTEDFLSQPDVARFLEQRGIPLNRVSDYKVYSLCDNPSPHLSVDRLEYTLSNIINFGLGTEKDVQEFLSDLSYQAEEGEIVFGTPELAHRFAMLALGCSETYVCPEDRGSMDTLAHLLREAISCGCIERKDLETTEDELLEKLMQNKDLKSKWMRFCALKEVDFENKTIRVNPKKRFIDPLVSGMGRASELFQDFAEHLETFKKQDLLEGFSLR